MDKKKKQQQRQTEKPGEGRENARISKKKYTEGINKNWEMY